MILELQNNMTNFIVKVLQFGKAYMYFPAVRKQF